MAQHPIVVRDTVRVRIAIAVFDGAEELYFAGPWELLAFWAREVAQAEVEVGTVAATLDPIRAADGLRVLPDRTWEDIGPIEVLVLPGGRGTRRLLGPDEPVHERHRGAGVGGFAAALSGSARAVRLRCRCPHTRTPPGLTPTHPTR